MRRRILNPPEAGLVDDLIAAALLLRCAASTRGDQGGLGLLCAHAAAQLEADAEVFRGRP